MNKEIFMAAHEELIEEYLEDHPWATDSEAYDATADGAYVRMKDKLADQADRARDEYKHRGM